MCPACAEARFVARRVAGLALRRCLGCGLWLSDLPEGAIDYAGVDEAAYLASIGRVREAQAKTIVEMVRDRARGEWLDVGCGFGYVLAAAREAGFRVRGIEPDPNAAAVARRRIGNVEEGLLRDDSAPADVLSTLDVIEHLRDLDGFARLVRSKARALWVIKVPSSEGLLFRVAHLLRIGGAVRRLWQAGYAHPHTVYFDRRSLTRFLDRSGFEVVAVRYLSEVPPGTVVGRLTLDGGWPRWLASLAVPFFVAVDAVERLRGKSDGMVAIARPR